MHKGMKEKELETVERKRDEMSDAQSLTFEVRMMLIIVRVML